MAKVTCKLNKSDLSRILNRANAIERALTSSDGPVYSYVLTVSNGYVQAVLSGMGTTSTGVLTLKNFLGEAKSVSWEPLSEVTKRRKIANNWKLEIWMATGETAKAVKVVEEKGNAGFTIRAGIDSGSKEYEKAVQAEFGGFSNPGDKPYNGRALFTLLNIVFKENVAKVEAGLMVAVRKAIKQSQWGT